MQLLEDDLFRTKIQNAADRDPLQKGINERRKDVNTILEHLSNTARPTPAEVDNQPSTTATPPVLSERQAAANQTIQFDRPNAVIANLPSLQQPVATAAEVTNTQPEADNQNDEASPASVDTPQTGNPIRQMASHQPRNQATRSDQNSASRRSNQNSTSRRSGRSARHSRRTSFRVKHEDSTDTDSSDSTEHSDTAPADNQQEEQTPNYGEIPFHNRRKGPKHPNLNSIVPSEERYDRLLSYRYYRLQKTNANRSNASTTRLHKTLKNLELTMKEHKFSGEDPILVFDFLSRLVEEADTNGMSEGQLIVCLPHLLTKTAAHQYRAASNSSRSSGVRYWPEAVQYLLRTYATETAIREALDQLDRIRQSPTEDEHAFAARVNEAIYRCGNVHEEVEKISFFINGLRDEIRTIVSRFRRDQPR